MKTRARALGNLPPDLEATAVGIEAVARAAGLDFFPVSFHLLEARDVNGVAAYGGFPVRFPSWRFGMEYERLEKGYRWGASKIYELVINNDPVFAYLVRSNSFMEQKLVIAHVFAHADFFKHNRWFGPTDRHMLDTMGRHSSRVRAMIDVQGQEPVEAFLDLALSLDSLIDPYLPLRQSARLVPRERRVAELPSHDVLGFLVEEAPLESWQAEILRSVRREAYYFQPQRMTKIMNEGWASFWHSRLLTGGILDASEIVDFADCHSAATVQAPGQLNPYKLGIELFRHAEASGRDIFRLRRLHNDTTLVDDLIDEEFVAANQLMVYGRNARSGRTEVLDRDWRAIKQRFLQELSWGGQPQISLVDVNAEGGGELCLLHHHDGRDLQLGMARETLKNLARIWKAPVHLLTREEERGRRLVCDAAGEEVEVLDTEEGGGET